MTKTNNTHRSTEALSLVPVSLPLGSVGGVLPLPIEHAPAVPEVTGQVRPTGRLRSVLTDQIEDAPRAASELLAFPDYDRLFGALVPKAKDIAEAMVFAHAWTLERRSAERWFDHTREQEMLAWDHAMGLVADLTGPLLLALERHPALKETLPVLMRFMLAKITAGKRGAAKRVVRARKAAAKEEVPNTEDPLPTIHRCTRRASPRVSARPFGGPSCFCPGHQGLRYAPHQAEGLRDSRAI